MAVKYQYTIALRDDEHEDGTAWVNTAFATCRNDAKQIALHWLDQVKESGAPVKGALIFLNNEWTLI